MKPFKSFLSSALMLPIRAYQLFISPYLPPTCRYTPTCSQYAIEAIRIHGPFKGIYLATRRILRCHPWGGSGYDPVPSKATKKEKHHDKFSVKINERLGAKLHEFEDCHTHNQEASNKAIINIPQEQLLTGQFQLNQSKQYSAGILPVPGLTEEKCQLMFQNIHNLISSCQLVAIGECGLDKRIEMPFEQQIFLFQSQIDIALSFQLPLIIHCVRSWQEVISICGKHTEEIPCVIHGFRGKPQLARQLLDSGFYLSFGKYFNQESFNLCPSSRRLLETD
ncbi:MAG: membrane protein insertion efficiency factor YidD [Prevotellaceae bacterium]|nr:membrane protein insertion efficiency factor YidD [Candidatus Faecinaster equi]